jgi:hypothetical protein
MITIKDYKKLTKDYYSNWHSYNWHIYKVYYKTIIYFIHWSFAYTIISNIELEAMEILIIKRFFKTKYIYVGPSAIVHSPKIKVLLLKDKAIFKPIDEILPYEILTKNEALELLI